MAEARRPGKEISSDDNPEDIPSDCPKKWSWKDFRKVVLRDAIDQGNGAYCWTIAFNIMVAAYLVINDIVPELLLLSAKHLYSHVEEKFRDGFLKNYKGVKTFLRDEGLIVEHDCKCKIGQSHNCNTIACDKVKDRSSFKISDLVVVEDAKEIDEKDIINLLKNGPVAAQIQIIQYDFRKFPGDQVYYGPSKSKAKIENHIILITGYGTTDGIHFFEYQNSFGTQWGFGGGFGRFARKISLRKGEDSLIKAYMYPKL